MAQSDIQALVRLRDLRRFDNFELLAKQVVEGTMIGLHKSPFHGFSVEFAEHRLYNQGDSLRNIDWKVFARTDKLFVKRFEEETNLRCRFCIDASSSMFFPEMNPKGTDQVAVNKFNFSVVSAAALMYLLRKQRDAVGLSIFSDRVESHSRARSTYSHQVRLMRQLESSLLDPKLNQSTDAAACLHEIAENVHKRSLVVIFSDMFDRAGDDLTELFAALQHLKHNRHEVVIFHVADYAKELEFDYANRPYQFVDMETGEEVKLTSNKIKTEYKQRMAAYKNEIYLKCAQFQIDFVEADINRDFTQILIPYLNKRARMSR